MFSIKFKQIKKSFLLIILSFFIFLSSCSNSSSLHNAYDKELLDKSNQINNSPTLDQAEKQNENGLESELLQIYWQSRDSYNPLDTFDYSGRAAHQLMHRSLLKIDTSNVLRTDLAKSIKYIAEKKLYEIELMQGMTFSNGNLIEATDCRESILAYRDYLINYLEPTKNQTNEIEDLEDDFTIDDETLEDLPSILAQEEFSESIKTDILKTELERLQLIQDIEIIDKTTFQIHLDPEKKNSEEQEKNEDEEIEVELDENVEYPSSINEIDSEFYDDKKMLDPGVLFALLMPIIPADIVDSKELPTITSGRYTVNRLEENSIFLKAVDVNFSIQDIELKSYENAAKAIKDIADDKLDLVYLSEENFNIYRKQNNKNMVSFPGQRFYYLSFGQGNNISEAGNKSLVKEIWQVRDDLAQFSNDDLPVGKVSLQYNDLAISDFNLFETQPNLQINESKIRSFSENKLELELIIPERTKEKEWALALRENMLDMNIDLDIKAVSSDEYPLILKEENYDLAINWLDIAYPMSISQTYQFIEETEDHGLNMADKETIAQLHQYFYSIDRQIDQKLLDENLYLYRDYIINNFIKLDILGIRFEQVGIILSHKVEGIPNSYISEPYNSLENLWVWQ